MRIITLLGLISCLTLLSSCTCSNCPSYKPEYLDEVNVTARHNF